MSTYLPADEAARRLGVSKPTLYAYVSRGLLRSRAQPGTRAREYAAADVEALLQRKQARRDPAAAAASALGVAGLPVLDSSLSSINDGQLRYRGRDVVRLAREETIEAVAALLWDGELPDEPALSSPATIARALRSLPPVAAMHGWLVAAGARDDAAYNLTPDGVRRTGARIVRGLAQVAAGFTRPAGGRIAEVLAAGWRPRGDEATRELEAALILSADHELNVSAFTARCVASARATPYMVVTAALAALQGHRHGGETLRTAAMLDEPGAPTRVIAARLERGERIPGFGHPLYPEGDPRARALLSLARPGRPLARARAFVKAARALLDSEPTLDLGLVALARSLELPQHAALSLFAVGRAVGWIAHALEQYAVEPMIRPRARYVGPPPIDAPLRG